MGGRPGPPRPIEEKASTARGRAFRRGNLPDLPDAFPGQVVIVVELTERRVAVWQAPPDDLTDVVRWLENGAVPVSDSASTPDACPGSKTRSSGASSA